MARVPAAPVPGHRRTAAGAGEPGRTPRTWFGERWIGSAHELFEENLRYFPPLLPICDDEDPLEVLDEGGVPALGELVLHDGTVYRWNRPVYGIADGVPHLRWRTVSCPPVRRSPT
ncbi:hypothetical protein SBADM41S_06701 [Streptomyces badius]